MQLNQVSGRRFVELMYMHLLVLTERRPSPQKTGFLFYITCVAVFSTYMIYQVAPKYGSKEPMVYLSICSLVGSVSVMAIKVSGRGGTLHHGHFASCAHIVSINTGIWNRAQAHLCRQQPAHPPFDLFVWSDRPGMHSRPDELL